MTLKSIISLIRREKPIPQRKLAEIRESEALKSQLQTVLNTEILRVTIRALREEMPIGAPTPMSNNDQFAYFLGMVQGQKNAFDALESLAVAATDEPKADFTEPSV